MFAISGSHVEIGPTAKSADPGADSCFCSSSCSAPVLCVWTFRVAAIILAAVNCWITRYKVSPDSISYLDVGDDYWKGNWHSAFNSYWSPLYSWITALVNHLLKPSIRWEFPLIHASTFLIFIAALCAFEFFWREVLLASQSEGEELYAMPAMWALAYVIFLYFHLVVHELWVVSPDLLVATLVYLAAALILKKVSGRGGALEAAILGIVLGLGYLAKAPMMLFAMFVIVGTAIVEWNRRKGRLRFAVMVVMFLAVVLPYVLLLSYHKGYITAGDSAKLNQAWLVNGVHPMYRHWQGDAAHPALHPTRKISQWPEVYEFREPIPGTYPVWYDPTYWNAGVDSSVHVRNEFVAVAANLFRYTRFLFTETALFTIPMLLLVFAGKPNQWSRVATSYWPAIVPCLAMFAVYGMAIWEARYISAFAAVLWTVALSSVRFGKSGLGPRILRSAAWLLVIAVGFNILLVLFYRALDTSREQARVVIAEQLSAMGIRPGTEMAIVGDGFGAYWARLARIRLIAEIPQALPTGDSAAAFWSLDSDGRDKILALLRASGAKAVLAENPPRVLPPGWKPISSTGRAVYIF